jgi:hypothetical protein
VISAALIARNLSGGRVRSGVHVVARDPRAKTRSDRSLSVWVDGDTIRVHSHRGWDWREAKSYVYQQLGLPAWKPKGRAALKWKAPFEARCQFLVEGLRIVRHRRRISGRQFGLIVNDLRNVCQDSELERRALAYAREFCIASDDLRAALQASWRAYTADERAAIWKTTYVEYRVLGLRRSGCAELGVLERRRLTKERGNAKKRADRVAKRRLAGECDLARENGEIFGPNCRERSGLERSPEDPAVVVIGPIRRDTHEAHLIQDPVSEPRTARTAAPVSRMKGGDSKKPSLKKVEITLLRNIDSNKQPPVLGGAVSGSGGGYPTLLKFRDFTLADWSHPRDIERYVVVAEAISASSLSFCSSSAPSIAMPDKQDPNRNPYRLANKGTAMIEKASRTKDFFISIKVPDLSLNDPFFEIWLRAAKNMQTLWLNLCDDKGFAHQVDRLRSYQEPDFSLAAMDLISKLETISGCRQKHVKICLADSFAEELTIMNLVGFLEQKRGLYEFTVPGAITSQAVKTACLVLAATQDDEFDLHPEYIIFGTAVAAKGKYRN